MLVNIEEGTQLLDYLKERGHLERGESPGMRILAGGVSNRTVLVKRVAGPSFVVKQALAKLRVKEDWFSNPERIHREAEGIRLLRTLAPAGMITRLVFEDTTHHLLCMEAVPEPHANWKQSLLEGEVDLRIVAQFGQCLGLIHQYNPDDYPADGIIQGLDFFESLRLEPYYLFTASHVPSAADFLHALVEETRKLKITLVHGDYSPKNILVRNGRMVLLDHEVIHLGDPAFDIGFSMTHLLSKAHHLKHKHAAFITTAFFYWETYAQISKRVDADFEYRAVKHTLACLLARVAGRSPLEYLTDEEKARQITLVRALIYDQPTRMADLIHAFSLNLSIQ